MNICPRYLFKKDFGSDIKSTAESFRTWNTCMDNQVCKIIAIVGIALASIILIWLIGSLLRCFQTGVSGIADFCCWCCCCCNGNRTQRMGQQYHIPMTNQPRPVDMYQPIRQPESAYYRNDNAYYEERIKSDPIHQEEDFDLEAQKQKSEAKLSNKRVNHHQNKIVYDEEPEEKELLINHPQMTSYQPTYDQSMQYQPSFEQPHTQNSNPFIEQSTISSATPYPQDDHVINQQKFNFHHSTY